MKKILLLILFSNNLILNAQALYTQGGVVGSFSNSHVQVNQDGGSNFGVGLQVLQWQVANSDGPKINFSKIMASSQKNWSMGILNGVNVPDFIINEDGGLGGFGTTRFIIKPGGNVGVGTVSPESKLDVLGQSGTGMRYNGTNSDFEALALFNTTASNLSSGNGAVLQFYNNSNNLNGLKGASIRSVSSNGYFGWESDLYLRTTKNNSYSSQAILDALVIKGGSGFVGIGTTSPDQRLTVNGTVHATEVNITATVPGPDYVFEKSYGLPSLDEVKSYIDENKHLPEVPSAKEIEKNGINVGEMNMLLLKKVEELTLYLIDQKREIENLKSEILIMNAKK